MRPTQRHSKLLIRLRKAISCLAAAFILGLSTTSKAGEFVCDGYGNNGCAQHIRDLVTKDFTKKYPADDYKIVVIYGFTPYSDGGGVGYAIAGISPVVKVNGGDYSIVPSRRFIRTTRLTGSFVGPKQRNELEVSLIRGAVENLMDACRKGPCLTP